MIGFIPLGNQNQPKGIPKATLQFILACTIVHFITWRISSVSPELMEDWFGLAGFGYDLPITALSCIFVHGSFDHLFFNMLFLFIFAAPVELLEGRKKFWKLVIITAFFSVYFSTLSSWLFYLWLPNADPQLRTYQYLSITRGGIGASGIVSAFMAAYLVRLWRSKVYAVIAILGIPLPKLFRLPAWAVVLMLSVPFDLYYGIFYKGMQGLGGVGYFVHVGGYISGAVMALYWGFHKHYKRDLYLEYAEDLANAPISGSRAAITTFMQALANDPQNGKIMLELARRHHFIGEHEKSGEFYRRATLALSNSKDQEKLLAEAYSEAFGRHQLVFASEKQLEMARLLLKYGHWQVAQKSLETFCASLAGGCQNLPLYIRGKLILAYILDYHAGRQDRAGEIIQTMLSNFPGHPLLKYAAERIEHQSEKNPLFKFNPNIPAYPFTMLQKRQAPEKQPPKLSWRQVRPKFLRKCALGIALAPIALLILLWLFALLKIVGHGLLGIA